MPYIRLPDNGLFRIPQGKSPEEALELARQKHPRAFMSPEEVESAQGFGPAFGEAWRGFKSESERGLAALTGSETLNKWAEQNEKESAENPHIATEDKDVSKGWEQGPMAGLGAFMRQKVTEPLGGIAGRYVLPTAAGVAGAGIATLAAPEIAAGSVLGGVGSLTAGALAGRGAMMATDFPAELGENLSRQKEQKQPQDVAAATAAALGQSALASFGIPGMGKLAPAAQKIFGKEASVLAKEVVAGQTSKEAALAQLNGTLKNIALGTGDAAVSGAGLMVGTEAMRRASAGQDVLGDEAMKEYGQQLVGAAELAPIFGVAHGAFKRSGEKKQIARAGEEFAEKDRLATQAKEDAEAASKAHLAEAQERQTVSGDLFGEGNNQGPGQLNEAQQGARVREAEELKPDPYEVQQQHQVVKQAYEQYNNEYTDAASKGDTAKMRELLPKLKATREAYEKSTAFFRENNPDIAVAELRGRETSIKDALAQLGEKAKNAKSQEELEKMHPQIDKLHTELEEVSTKLKEATAKQEAAAEAKRQHEATRERDLFDVEKDQIYDEMRQRGMDEQRAREEANRNAAHEEAHGEETDRRNEQAHADLAGSQPREQTLEQKKQAELTAAYEESLQQLEEAHRAGADKRSQKLLDELLEKAIQAAAAKAAAVPKSSEGGGKPERIARQQRAVELIAEKLRWTEREAELVANGSRLEVADTAPEADRKKAEIARRNMEAHSQLLAHDKAEAQIKELKAKIKEIEKTPGAFERGETPEQTKARIEQATAPLHAQVAELQKQMLSKSKVATQRKYAEVHAQEVGALHDEIHHLRMRMANALHALSNVRPQERIANALEKEHDIVADFKLHAQDLFAKKPKGPLRVPIRNDVTAFASKYTHEAIKEVNATRDMHSMRPMPVAEAIKLGIEIHKSFHDIIRKRLIKSLEVGNGGMTVLEVRLAQIKEKYRSVQPKMERGPEALRQERVPRTLGETKAQEEAQRIARSLSERQQQVRDVEQRVEREKKQETPDAERIRQLETYAKQEQASIYADQEKLLTGIDKQIAEVEKDASSADQNVRRAALVRLQELYKTRTQYSLNPEGAERAERLAREEHLLAGTKEPEQRGLFNDKELEPTVTQRATPSAFQRLLRSNTVQKLREKFGVITNLFQRGMEEYRVRQMKELSDTRKMAQTELDGIDDHRIQLLVDTRKLMDVKSKIEASTPNTLHETRKQAQLDNLDIQIEKRQTEYAALTKKSVELNSYIDELAKKSKEHTADAADVNNLRTVGNLRANLARSIHMLAEANKIPEMLRRLLAEREELSKSKPISSEEIHAKYSLPYGEKGFEQIEAYERTLEKQLKNNREVINNVAAVYLESAKAVADAAEAYNVAKGASENPRVLEKARRAVEKAKAVAAASLDAHKQEAAKAIEYNKEVVAAQAELKAFYAELKKAEVDNEAHRESLKSKDENIKRLRETFNDALANNIGQERANIMRLEEALKGREKDTPAAKHDAAALEAARAREKQLQQLMDAERRAKDEHGQAMQKAQESLAKYTSFRQEAVATRRNADTIRVEKAHDLITAHIMAEMKEVHPDPIKLQRLLRDRAEVEESLLTGTAKKIRKAIVPEDAEATREAEKAHQLEIAKELGEKQKRRALHKLKAKAQQQLTKFNDELVQLYADRTAAYERMDGDAVKKLNARIQRRQAQVVGARLAYDRVTKATAGTHSVAERKSIDDQRNKDLKVLQAQAQAALKRGEVPSKAILDKIGTLVAEAAEARMQGVGVEAALLIKGETKRVELAGKLPSEPKKAKKEMTPEAKEDLRLKRAEAAEAKKEMKEGVAPDVSAPLPATNTDLEKWYKGNQNALELDTGEGVSLRLVKHVDEGRIAPADAVGIMRDTSKNLPDGMKVEFSSNFESLSAKDKAALAKTGVHEGSDFAHTVRGFTRPDGTVVIITGNHADKVDLQKTIVHETVGHVGVDSMVGREGMEKLTKAITAQEGGVYALAEKLGVSAELKSAVYDYWLNIKQMERDGASKESIEKAIADGELRATREMIAYTTEQRVTDSMLKKAGKWLQALVGAVRAWAREKGFAEFAKMGTSDIYHLIAKAERAYRRNQMGAFRDMDGGVSFRSKPEFSSSAPGAFASASRKIIAQQRPWRDRIQGNALGLSLMTRMGDTFAPLAHIAKHMKNGLEGVQMMYFNRLYYQSNNMVSEQATHGPVMLEFDKKHNTWQYKSSGKPGLAKVFEAVGKSKEYGNAEAAMQSFSTYMALEKAMTLKDGLKVLDMEGKLTKDEIDTILKHGRADKNFQEARTMYREYNNGLLDLLVQTGAMSEARATELKKGDYIPYYRIRDGAVVDDVHNVRIGDIRSHPYLRELVGGDSAIISLETSALQNTKMLTDLAMGNIATKNTAYTLQKLGMAEIHLGKGPLGPDVIRFYEKGEEKYARINTRDAYVDMEENLAAMRAKGNGGTPEYKALRERAEKSRESSALFGHIPAELIVRGMEGVGITIPSSLSMLRMPSNFLRKAVTRNPLYALRIAMKDSISGWLGTGADVKPVIDTLKSLRDVYGDHKNPTIRELQAQGVTGGHVFNGTMDDMRKVALQMSEGKSGWEKLWAKADRMAMMADESQRLTLYNGFIKKGLSPMEASLATLEAQNFTKHGYSPTMRMLSVVIPFFNSQMSGLTTFMENLSGKSLFEKKLGVREAAFKRGAMLAGTTLAYTALMQNNEAYRNASETDKLNYWFIPMPGFKEPIRVPIPFEAGTVFKALPEAAFNMMFSDTKNKDILNAVRQQVTSNIPGYTSGFLPQGVKPIFEAATNMDFFSGRPIESARQLSELPGFRSSANTTEVSKGLGEAFGISPVQLDHAINAYTGGVGIALLSMFNPVLRAGTAAEMNASQLPIAGSLFQPTDAPGLINKAYEAMQELEKVNTTYKHLEETDPIKAEAFEKRYSRELDAASEGGKFKQEMGKLNKEEREVQADRSMGAVQKRRLLDEIRKEKIDLAKDFRSTLGE